MSLHNCEILDQIVNRSDLGIIVLDNSLNIVMWNKWMALYSGKQAKDIETKSLIEECPELENSRVHEAIINTLELEQPAVISNVLNRTPFDLYSPFSGEKTTSTKIQQAIKILPLPMKDKPCHCIIQISDVSASVKREQSLERQVRERIRIEQKLSQERSLFIAGPTVVLTWVDNPEWRIDYISPNVTQQLGYQVADFLNGDLNYDDLIHPEDYKINCTELPIDKFKKIIEEVDFIEREYRIKTASGEYHWVYNLTRMIRDDADNSIKYLGYLLDITERKLNESKVERQAYYDELTGLPNRRMFIERLDRELARSKRQKYKGAVFFIDLDRFKSINDSLGHAAGDELLKNTADRLQRCLRLEDTAARLGGDEFVVILPNLGKSKDKIRDNALLVAEKVRQSLAKPHIIQGSEVISTPSIGVVAYPSVHQSSADDLIRHADTAMYRAKTAGRNEIRFFSLEMQQQVDEQAQLEKDLHDAFEKGEFSLNYQPLFNGKHEILSAECLLRWQHPDRGWVSPAEFIPMAEESGFIIRLGEWVLREACRQLKSWEKIKSSNKGFRFPLLAVNVSPKQFRQENFVQQVNDIVSEYGIKPSQLEIELTEGVVIADVDDTIDKMHQLKAVGIHIAIDDFGTGYSSLSYLKKLPIDVLKIDQSFVCDITHDTNNMAIVNSIISMATHMGLNITAEGVENREQLNHLIKQGCHVFQGYYFSKPLTAENFSRFYIKNTIEPSKAIQKSILCDYKPTKVDFELLPIFDSAVNS